MPVYNVTFKDWFNGVVNTPITAPQQALTIVRNGAKNKYIVLKYTVEPPTNKTKQADIQIALAQGDTEEIRDLKGTTTELSLTELTGTPVSTIKKILSKTLEDTFNIDELGAMKSARIMGNLTRGKTEDEEGRDLAKPSSVILKAMGVTYPSLVNAGLHEYQLLVDAAPSQPKANYIDRRSLEVGEDVNPTFRTYEKQASSMHAMAENDEIASSRLAYRNENIQNFNRTSLRELELNLAHTFSHDKAGGQKVTGALNKYLRDHEHLPDISDPNYNTTMAGILGISPADFADPAKYSDVTKNYIHTIVEAEAHNIKITLDPYLGKKINTAVAAQLGFSAGAYPAGMSADIKSAWEGFIGFNPATGRTKEMAVKDRMEAYDNLRNAYLKEGKIADWRKVAVADLGLEIDTAKYGGIRMTNLFEEDMNFLYQRKLVESYMFFENHAAEIKRDIYNAAVSRRGQANDGQLALSRFESAANNIRLSNNMFFASTTKEMLENLRDGRFMSNALVVSRFFNTIPYIDEEFRNLKAYTKLIDPTTYLSGIEKNRFVSKLGKFVFDDEKTPITGLSKNMAAFLGVGFEGKELPTRGVMPIAKTILGEKRLKNLYENKHYHLYQKYTPTASSTRVIPAGSWEVIGVTSSQVGGLFGQNSVFQILQEVESMNMLSGVMSIGVHDFISNPNNLLSLQNAIQTVSTAGAGYIPLNAFEELAFHLGFADGGLRMAHAGEFIANFQTALNNGGMAWLQGVAASGKVPPDELWKFMQSMVNTGKANSLVTAQVVGPLQKFNRYANLGKDFLYKNVIWGQYGSWIPGINKLRLLMRDTLGMSESIGLIRAAEQWGWVNRWIERGQIFNAMGQGTFTAQAGGFASSKMASWLARKAATSTVWRGIVQSLAYSLTNAAGIVSGGIGFVLATVGTIGFNAAMKLLKGDVVGVYYSIKEDVTGLVNVAKKLIIYPIVLIISIPCGCIFVFILIITAIIPGMIAPYEELVGGVSAVLNSEMIKVEKNASIDFFGSTIRYTVVVENISDKPVTISSFSDKLVMVGPCNASGSSGGSFTYGEPGFKGQLADSSGNDIPGIDFIEAQFLGKILDPGDRIEYSFRLNDYGTDPATFYNTIEVAVAEEATKSASDSTSSAVFGGGCTQCPSTWPVSGYSITQGPNTGSGTHASAEAVDLAVPRGTTVTATHDGTAKVRAGCVEGDKSCNGGFGNFVEIFSPLGFSSIYAHLTSASVSNGDLVTANETIGLSGTTGNSTGPHVHYEFRKPYQDCFPGQKVTMREPYIPDNDEIGR